MDRLNQIRKRFDAVMKPTNDQHISNFKWIQIVEDIKRDCLSDFGFLFNHIDTLELMLEALRSENENFRSLYGTFNIFKKGK